MWKLLTPVGATAMSSSANSCRMMHMQSGPKSDNCLRSILSCRSSVHRQFASQNVRHRTGKRGRLGGAGGVGGTAYATYTGSGGLNGASGMASSPAPRICILGGGFGGLYTAVRLENLIWPQSRKPQITLIDKNDRFVFKPLLYEIINGAATPEEVAPFFSDLVGPMRNTQFLKGSVQSVHTESAATSVSSGSTGGTIKLADGQQLQFDWLVLALGSSTSTFGIPGVKEYAYAFNDFNDAMRVLHRVEELERRASLVTAEVMVVGAGPAGVELASTVAERLGSKAHVQLVSAGPDILQGLPAGQVKVAHSMLQDLNVDVVTNAMVSSIRQGQQSSSAGASTSQAASPDAQQSHVDLKLNNDGKSTVTADMVLWTAGSSPASHEARKLNLPFDTNKKGATLTDRNLQVLKQARVFALGDVAGSEIEAETADLAPTAQSCLGFAWHVAAVQGLVVYLPTIEEHVRQKAKVAFQQADYVAWNLWSAINNRPLLPFKYQHLGDMMSLGRVNGAVTFPVPVSQQLAAGLQSGPFASLLGAAGISLNPDDSSKGLTLQGPLGGLVRRAAYLYRQPTDRHRFKPARQLATERQPGPSSPILKISYNGNSLSNGTKLLPSHAQKAPTVKFDGGYTYTLLLIDPDVPSRKDPKMRNFVHWLVTNVPKDAISNGQTVLQYKPPAPPEGTGYHRYIFLLFDQGQSTIQVKKPDSRGKFDVDEFAEQYGLGTPVAVFYFLAEYEDTLTNAIKETLAEWSQW